MPDEVFESQIEALGEEFNVLKGFADDLTDGLEDPDLSVAPEADLLAEEVKLGCTLAMLSCLDRDHRVAWILGEVMSFPVEPGRGVLLW